MEKIIMEQQEINDTVEELIVREGLKKVLIALSNICWLKAEHLEINLHDIYLAEKWTFISKEIEKLTKLKIERKKI